MFFAQASSGIAQKFYVAILLLAFCGAPATADNKTSPNAPPAASVPPSENIGDLIRFPVEKFKLENGLTVLMYVDHTIPQINYQTWYRVGSKDEEPGYTGIAHLFEHLMFLGAKRYSGEQFEMALRGNGGYNNAATTTDYTYFYETLPAGKLELLTDIESDRMVNLQVTDETLRTERQVVKEERRYRVDSNPVGVLMEVLNEAAFKVHAYKWPTIGYMADLDRINVEKAKEFYHNYYAPNNATVVIAGDFDPENAKALIAQYYGPLPAHPPVDRTRPQEPPQQSGRSAMVERDVQNTQFAIAYHTPKAGEDDAYALDLLANVMGFGPSSRLHQRLVYRDQTALDVEVGNITMKDSGLFEIFVTLRSGIPQKRIQSSVLGEMWRMRGQRLQENELQKAKNQVMKGYVDSLKTLQGKGESLAMNETLFGDYSGLFNDLGRYSRVTVDDIKRVAGKYLTPEKATIVVLRPKRPPTTLPGKKGAKS